VDVSRRALLAGLAGSACLPLFAPAAARAYVEHVNGVEVIVDGLDPKPRPASKNALPGPRRESQAAQQRRLTPGTPAVAVPAGDQRAARVIAFAERFVGVPYVWGGATPSGFDCSGFVQYAFRAVGLALPRTADVQFAWGRPIAGFPVPGDLVFFQTYEPGPSHVGLYLGAGWFVNSVGTHVQYSSFGSSYFRDRYLGARRVLAAG